ncbi:MAG: hypothetical protein ACNI27_13055 [Desulfovibrio sp.]
MSQYKWFVVGCLVMILALFATLAHAGKPTFLCVCLPPEAQAQSTSKAALSGIEEAMSSVDMVPYSQHAVQGMYDEFKRLSAGGMSKEMLKKFTRKHDVDMLLLYTPEVHLKRTGGDMDVAKIMLTETVVDGEDGTIIIEKKASWPIKVNTGETNIQNNFISIRAMRSTGKALTEKIMDADAMLVRYFY